MKRRYLFAVTLLALGCGYGISKAETGEEPSIKTGFVTVDSTKLYYEEMGSGKPLILIHGGLVDRRMWDGQFAEFAEHLSSDSI